MAGANHSRRGVAIDGFILRTRVQQRIHIAARHSNAVNAKTQHNRGNYTDGGKFNGDCSLMTRHRKAECHIVRQRARRS